MESFRFSFSLAVHLSSHTAVGLHRAAIYIHLFVSVFLRSFIPLSLVTHFSFYLPIYASFMLRFEHFVGHCTAPFFVLFFKSLQSDFQPT